MENDSQPPNKWDAHFAATPVVVDPSVTPADGSTDQAQEKPFNIGSLVLLVLLMLTFFSPLGSVLFLPITIVGMVIAYRYVIKGQKPNGEPSALQKNPIFKVVKFLFICGMAFVLCILGFIALVFIGLATGIIKINFGC